MDVSSFMGGNYLTHLDLVAPSQVWTIRDVKQELVGSDQKIVVYFNEHEKGLGLNKINLRTIAQAYTVQSGSWLGKRLEVYKDQTQFQGRVVPCVRVRIPSTPAPDMAAQPAPSSAAIAQTNPQPAPTPQPLAAPVPQTQQAAPAVSQPTPWDVQDANNPPSA